MRKTLITGFAIGVALAVVGSVATPARATYPGANGRLAFGMAKDPQHLAAADV